MFDGFEWDQRKALSNLAKHGIAFEEAATVFGDGRSITTHDPDHSAAEDRFVTIGLSVEGRLITVVHTDREARVRLINARRATRSEEAMYGKD